MLRSFACVLALSFAASAVPSAPAGEPYARAGWEARMPPGSASTSGVAVIVDERTIRLHHLNYSGAAPLVYLYLGADDAYAAFFDGIPIGPELHAMSDACLTVQLPEGQTLDAWGAISVWCVEFDVLFTSAAFAPPACGSDFAGDGCGPDGTVGVAELLEVLGGWGSCTDPGCPADVTFDGTVDVADLLAVLADWGDC